MKISVLSGKGGTGKTLVSTNLAYVLKPCLYIDCDIEEPNGSIFLKPFIKERQEISVMIPRFDELKCTGCRECVDFCKFNALFYANNRVNIFEKLCHGCMGCVYLCKYGALNQDKRFIGFWERGYNSDIEFRHGLLNEGEPSGIKIINKLVDNLPEKKVCIVDCPPGSSCNVIESIKNSDYCILVTEPTLFGVYNLKMVHELCVILNIPCGVVVNKDIENNNLVRDYCVNNSIDLLASIKYHDKIAKIVSEGKLLVEEMPQYKDIFMNIYNKILEVLGFETNNSVKR